MNLTEISTNGLLNGTLLNVRRPWGLSPVDNSYKVLPEETVALIRKICFLGICPFLIVVGVFLNAICLVMFIKLARTVTFKSCSSTNGSLYWMSRIAGSIHV
jgi:hypothetical protein